MQKIQRLGSRSSQLPLSSPSCSSAPETVDRPQDCCQRDAGVGAIRIRHVQHGHLGDVDGNGQADASAATGAADYLSVYAHDSPFAVQQWSAGIPRIDRGVGLDNLGNCELAGPAADGATHRASLYRKKLILSRNTPMPGQIRP